MIAPGAYAEGAAQGAPYAIQVADGWHLLSNLREAVQRLLDRHHKSLPALPLLPSNLGLDAPVPLTEKSPVEPCAQEATTQVPRCQVEHATGTSCSPARSVLASRRLAPTWSIYSRHCTASGAGSPDGAALHKC